MNDIRKKKIGILGGTFNPIHNGHLMLAQSALDQFALDSVHIMPTGISYLKQGTGVLSSNVRLDMCRIAIEDNPKFILDQREIIRGTNTYTCDTIEEMNLEFGQDAELYFILGADSLLYMQNWRNPEVIFRGCTVLAAVRGSNTPLELQECIDNYKQRFGARIELLETPYIDISSTQIRDMIQKGHSAKYLIPDSVLEYIRHNHLYENEK